MRPASSSRRNPAYGTALDCRRASEGRAQAESKTIRLEDVTALIGGNGAAKSAVLGALSRLFGLTGDDRRLVREDCHIGPDQSIDDLGEELRRSIEARLDFPELEDAEDDGTGEGLAAVPLLFRQMAVEAPGATPYCRVRLGPGGRATCRKARSNGH